MFCKGKGIRRDDLGDTGVRCIRYGDLYTQYENYVVRPASRIPQHVANAAQRIQHGDLLFAGSGETADEIGICVAYLGDDTAYAGGDIIILRVPGQDAVYLAHLLNSPVVARKKARMAQGDAVVHIRGDHLAEIEIPLPPLREQRAIAAVLRDVDELIGSLEALIAKKQDIKQAAMQQLLTGRTRLPGFGGEWEVVTLGQIGVITGAGVNKKHAPYEQTVRLLNYLSVYRERFIFSRHLTQTVTAPERQLRKCAIRGGDVFFTPTSETPSDIGNAAVALDDISDGVYSYHVVRLRLHVNWDPRFPAYVFDTASFRNQTSRMAEGSGTRYVITLPRFRSLTVCVPQDLPEQQAIATILSDMDAEITALEHRLDKARAIKQGMMQQLLTGRIRLIDPHATPGRETAP